MLRSEPARILIVDDDADIRANLCDILEMFGYEPSSVGTSGEALQFPNLPSVSVILLDRRLPDLRAEEALPLLRELVPDTDVVIVTGHADLDSTIAALRLGASDYLLKPINPEALRISIERCLEGRRLRNEKQRTETVFRQLVESAGSVITITRANHSIVYSNPFAEGLFGLLDDLEVDQRGIASRIDEPDRQRVLAAFARVLNDEELHDFEFSVVDLRGARRWLLCNVRRLDDYDGEPAVLLVGHDITGRRDAEQRLMLLNAAIAHLEEGVLLTQTEDDWFGSRVVYANSALCRMMDCEADDFVDRSPQWFMDLPTNELLREQIHDALIAGRPFTGECLARRQDGMQFPIELHLSYVTDSAGRRTHVVSTIRDITSRRAGEERLLRSERLAAIGKAMTGLAHESRNALQRAQASLDMLAIDLEGNDQATKLIKRIQVAQGDLHRLYEDVREYARPLRIEPRPHRIDELLRQAWDELVLKRAGHETSLTEVVETDDLTCHVEAFAIRQVFHNLLDNSLAAREQGTQITVHWSGVQWRGKPALRVSIRDNGPGVNSEHRTRMFDEFFTTKTRGTGLGLAISRRIIDGHDGSITAGEENSPGLEMIIILPRRPDLAATSLTASE